MPKSSLVDEAGAPMVQPVSERARDIERLFAEDGPIAAAAVGYRKRAAQVEMAAAIAEAIDGQACLVAEAGTGTGDRKSTRLNSSH